MCRVQMRQIHTDLLLIGCYLHPLGHCIHVHAIKSLQTYIYCNHDCSWLKHWVQSDHLSTEIFLLLSFHVSEPSLFVLHFLPLSCVFSGWKDAFCPLSPHHAATHKRCWPREARLGFRVPPLGFSLHKNDLKNTQYYWNPRAQEGLRCHWKATVASSPDFFKCSEPASQHSGPM